MSKDMNVEGSEVRLPPRPAGLLTVLRTSLQQDEAVDFFEGLWYNDEGLSTPTSVEQVLQEFKAPMNIVVCF